MTMWYFSGVVHPERASLTVSNINSQILTVDGKATKLTLNVYNNQVTVSAETDETDLHTVRNFVRSEVEFATNVAGFLLGYGYDVEITKAFNEALSETLVFGIDIPVLAERAKSRDFATAANIVFPLCFGEMAIFLRRCLADLSFSLKRLDDTAFYCFRALESLRQSFGREQNLSSDADQWKAMAVALGTSKDEMERLRTHAFPARHGIPTPLSDEERQQLLLYTWDVVERYIDYRLAKAGASGRIRLDRGSD
jgi:hypothetical protein